MKIDYKQNRVFPLMFVMIGATLCLCGLILLSSFNSNAIVGLVLLAIGVIIVFTRKGAIIDFRERKIKYYIGLFFIRIGNWKTIESYSFISILHLNQQSSGYSRTGIKFTEKTKVYRIYLLNNSHREKLKINDFKDLEIATLEANKIAKKLNFEFVIYNPV